MTCENQDIIWGVFWIFFLFLFFFLLFFMPFRYYRNSYIVEMKPTRYLNRPSTQLETVIVR
jgi:hypothetical protein